MTEKAEALAVELSPQWLTELATRFSEWWQEALDRIDAEIPTRPPWNPASPLPQALGACAPSAPPRRGHHLPVSEFEAKLPEPIFQIF